MLHTWVSCAVRPLLETSAHPSIVDSLKMGRLQGLDVSRCSLSDMDLRDLFEAIGYNAHPVQLLDISGNLGRIPATMVPNTIGLFMELRELNLYGTLLGAVQGPLLPFEALDNLVHLQELDISHSKVFFYPPQKNPRNS